MKNFINIKFLIVVILLLFAGLISWQSYFKEYSQHDTVNIHEFPRQFDGWISKELKITDHEYEILETRNAFSREYTNTSGDKVYLFIVYSQHNRKVSHPPEICYRGSGATILNSQSIQIDVDHPKTVIKANKLILEMGNMRQLMYYWFKVGDTFIPNYWKQQGLIAIKNFLGQPASSALIRISATVREEDYDTVSQVIENFVKTITPSLIKKLK